jgi:riboflavin synthase
MFTGIIETKGIVSRILSSLSNLEIYIQSNLTNDLKIDQSISHNGVCLTVDALQDDGHRCTLVEETLNKTNFKSVKVGDYINLERSLLSNSRMDGHFVQGHVDCITRCIEMIDKNGSWIYTFELPKQYQQLIVQKGSVCINGISLTVSDLFHASFNVTIIPYTFHHTNFNALQVGQEVNIEFDILGKYINRMYEVREHQGLLR